MCYFCEIFMGCHIYCIISKNSALVKHQYFSTLTVKTTIKNCYNPVNRNPVAQDTNLATENNSSQPPELDLNPRSLDCKSDVLMVQPRCLNLLLSSPSSSSSSLCYYQTSKLNLLVLRSLIAI